MGSNTSIGVSVSWGVVSLSVSSGATSDRSSVGGIFVNVPGDGCHYIVKLRKNYTIYHRKLDYYHYEEYEFTIYRDEYNLDSIDVLLEKV